jgi:hypothetical protein
VKIKLAEIQNSASRIDMPLEEAIFRLSKVQFKGLPSNAIVPPIQTNEYLLEKRASVDAFDMKSQASSSEMS